MVLLGLGISAVTAVIIVAVLGIAAIIAVIYMSNKSEGYIADEPICHDLSKIYGIKSGQSFGTAPPHIKQAWMKKGCDGGYAPGLYQAIASKSPKAVEDALKKAVYENYRDFNSCVKMQHDFGISSGETWGSANAHIQNRWNALGCDSAPVRRHYYTASAALPGPVTAPNYVKGGDFTVLQYEPHAQHSFRVKPSIVEGPWNYPL